jgi:hypothetical protein
MYERNLAATDGPAPALLELTKSVIAHLGERPDASGFATIDSPERQVGR